MHFNLKIISILQCFQFHDCFIYILHHFLQGAHIKEYLHYNVFSNAFLTNSDNKSDSVANEKSFISWFRYIYVVVYIYNFKRISLTHTLKGLNINLNWGIFWIAGCSIILYNDVFQQSNIIVTLSLKSIFYRFEKLNMNLHIKLWIYVTNLTLDSKINNELYINVE